MELKDKIDIRIKIIGLILTSITIIVAFISYNNTDKWKNLEFLTAKFKDFENNESVLIAQQLLDYKAGNVKLPGTDTTIYLTDEYVSRALRIDTIDGEFNLVEKKIRDVFDEYFNRLSDFNQYGKLSSRTYDFIKERPSITYYLPIIADSRNTSKTIKFKNDICNYIKYYRFTGTIELCNLLGYDMLKNKCSK